MSCLQVGRSKWSGCLCSSGERVELALVAGGDVCCPFAPRVFGGVCCAGLPAEVAPREATAVEIGRGGCILTAPKVCWGLGWR